jgi:hypothetical protein
VSGSASRLSDPDDHGIRTDEVFDARLAKARVPHPAMTIGARVAIKLEEARSHEGVRKSRADRGCRPRRPVRLSTVSRNVQAERPSTLFPAHRGEASAGAKAFELGRMRAMNRRLWVSRHDAEFPGNLANAMRLQRGDGCQLDGLRKR